MGRTNCGNVTWLCKCDCGAEHVVAEGKLVGKTTKSCGCYATELHIKQLTRHGITVGKTPRTLTVWAGMKARCNNPTAVSYKAYGARGIRVCSEWLGEDGFKNFHNWAITHGYSDELEIDRIDNDGNYEPSNCRWVSKRENRMRQKQMRWFEVEGITHNISQWCRELKISKATDIKLCTKAMNSSWLW